MAVLLSPSAKQQFFDNDSNAAAGFLLYTYATGTSTPQATYSNRAGTSANTNPIVLDARGEATIYLTPGVVYDYVLKTAAGVTVWTRTGVTADAGDAAAVLFTPAGDTAVTRTMQDKERDVVSLRDFGAVGDGTTVDSDAVQDAFDWCIVNGKGLYVPPGTYILDSAPAGVLTPIRLNFTEDGQSLHVYGAGRGVSVFKEKSGATLAGGRFTKMFYLELDSSVQIRDINFTDITFDKNGASNGAEPSSFAWEQAHVFSIASADWSIIDPHIESISFVRTNIRDKVGAGYHFAAAMTIGRVLFEDFYESDFSELFGERGDLEPTCWSEDICLNNVSARFMQAEALSAFASSADNRKVYKFSNCTIGTLQMGETDYVAAAGFSTVIANNSTFPTEFSTRGFNVLMNNSTWRHQIEHWAQSAQFNNCTIKLPYNSGTNAATSYYIKAIAGFPEKWVHNGCRFVLDSDDPLVQATGSAVGAANNAKVETAGEHVIVFDAECSFDPRFEHVVDNISGCGDYHVRNSTLACWGTPAMYVGGSGAFIGRLHLKGNDYSGCAGTNLVQVAKGNALWELRWDDDLPIAEYKITQSGGTAIGTCYPVRPRITTASLPTTAAASQRFHAGDRAKNTLPSATSPVTEWVCITEGIPGTWRAASWLTIKGTTAARPTLTSSDIGVTYLDTTLAAAGQLISWTGTAWVDSAGVAV